MEEEVLKSLSNIRLKTLALVLFLKRNNRVFKRDIDIIANKKRRLRRIIPTIPALLGSAGAILGSGADDDDPAFLIGGPPILPIGGGDDTQILPSSKRTKTPTPQEDSIRVEEDIKVDVREDVKQDIRIPETVPDIVPKTVPDIVPKTVPDIVPDTSKDLTGEQASGTDVKTGIVDGTDVITKTLKEKGNILDNDVVNPSTEQILSGVLATETATIKPYNPTFIEQMGNVFNSWFADRNRRNKWLKSPEYKILQLELTKMNVSDVDIDWGAVFDWTVAIGAVAFPGDAVFGDLAAVANLLMKGRITWGLLVRVFGKKGVEKLYNYFMQKGIQVPQWNLSSSIKPNSSSFNIASASDSVTSDGLHSHTRKKDVFVFITDQSIA